MDLDLIIGTLYLFLISLVFAALEVQIEGKNGWASALPTWRPSHGGLLSKIYRALLFGKDVTGYHLLIFTLLLAILHYPYFSGKSWNLTLELQTISYFFLLSIVWDFLWFVLNPHYGLFNFKQKNIWWHKKWFFCLPVDYWLGLALSALFYVKFSFNPPLLKEWLQILSLFLLLVLGITIFAVIAKSMRLEQS